jgi:hypothetical protein
MDREEYERNLKKVQEEHLRRVAGNVDNVNGMFQPCAHDGCPACHGTGVRIDGSACVHNLYCSCPKCSPRC